MTAAKQSGQEGGSVFGDPGLRVVKQLLPPNSSEGEWQKRELSWDGQVYLPWKVTDFLADRTSPLARSGSGQALGLDPQVFR